MASDQIYLTVAREKRQPENDGYLAIISMGSPQHGDSDVKVLDVNIVPNMRVARRWFKRMTVERPWETRS